MTSKKKLKSLSKKTFSLKRIYFYCFKTEILYKDILIRMCTYNTFFMFNNQSRQFSLTGFIFLVKGQFF